MRALLLSFSLLICVVLKAQSTQAKLANEYYQQGELEKARSMFEELVRDKSAIPLIHANYYQLLLSQKDYKELEKYMSRVLSSYPSNLQYQSDALRYFAETGQTDKKQKHADRLQKELAGNPYQLSSLAQYLVSAQLYDDALQFYRLARSLHGRTSAFALEMAAVHRITNDKAAMTDEYINYAEGNPGNLAYVKNLFQNILSDEKDQEYLEASLIKRIQRYPDETMYVDLLIWLELQRKNFYAAFLQARAIDKRTNQRGDECMQIAHVAFDNGAWQDALDIFGYVIKEFPSGTNYAEAKRMLIKSRENKVKTTFPVDQTEIRLLATSYAQLHQELGENYIGLDARRHQALLHAFYLNELDTAIALLTGIVTNRRAPVNLIAESKLDLGDIYILNNEPWEATLLYSQVEKAHKESPLAYEAKFRNARVNYYIGNFALAKSHLAILKLATTREISNDAIALGLLINDNTVFDTTDVVMQEFAEIELLLFQNQYAAALLRLDDLRAANPGHSITDESYWLTAQIQMKTGAYQEAVVALDQIISRYHDDILGDDAMYLKGVILQDYLKSGEVMELFTQFLKKYPGSKFAAEARNRIRLLRATAVAQ